MSLVQIVLVVFVAALAVVLAIVAYNLFLTRRIVRTARQLVPPPGKFVEIDGNRIHYVEKGAGRPILFVHGLGGTQFHFSWPLFRLLENDFRLIALDRPGSGFSTRAGDKPASPSEQAAFVARFIEKMGLEKPLLVGHSLGGAISLATALDHPDSISGIALFSPLTRHIREVSPEFAGLDIRSPLKRRLVAEIFSAPMGVKMGPATLSYVFGPQEPPEGYAVEGGAMAALLPSHFYASSTDFVAVGPDMARQEKRYGELSMPVGVLFGDADRVVNFDKNGRWLEGQVKGLGAEVFEGVGHMPQYADPDRSAAFIRRMAGKAFAT